MTNHREMLKVTEKLAEYRGSDTIYKAGSKDRLEINFPNFDFYYYNTVIFRLIGGKGYVIPENLKEYIPITASVTRRINDYIWYFENLGYKRIG